MEGKVPMSTKKHCLLVAGAVAFVLLAGGLAFVWPSYRQTKAIDDQVGRLQRKIDGLAGETETLVRLVRDVGEAQRQVDEELKQVPAAPEIASLMPQLSLPVDGERVLDQTFNAGNPVEAVPGDPDAPQAVPVIIEMQATFDSIFAILRAAETMDRLIRVTSVRIACERPDEEQDQDILTASIGLDAIYDPSEGAQP